MELKDIEERVDKLEKNQIELKDFVNKSINDIQIGIAEIKVMLKERLEQENLRNNLLAKDIETHNNRISKLEDSQQWLRRTVAGQLVTIIIGIIVFVIKMMA